MTTGPKPSPIPVDWKPYHDGEQMNFTATSLRLGNPMTGSEKSGWCLYAMRGSCWNQRTKAAFPPEQGMKPELSGGAWVWAGDPKPAPATMRSLCEQAMQCAIEVGLDSNNLAAIGKETVLCARLHHRCSPETMLTVMTALEEAVEKCNRFDIRSDNLQHAIALLNATSERAGGVE